MKPRLAERMPYRGAGILFVNQGDEGPTVLLACRRNSGVWSIPGGKRDEGDRNDWDTAVRETREEFGLIPEGFDRKPGLIIPFGFLGFHWRTFVVELAEHPASFPDHSARDFRQEFREACWFPLSAVPPKTHWLLLPLLIRLRFAKRSLRTKNPN